MSKIKSISPRKKVVAIFMLLYIIVIIFLPAQVSWEGGRSPYSVDYGYRIVTINNIGEFPSYLGNTTIKNGVFHRDFALPIFLTELAVLTVLFLGSMYLAGGKRTTNGTSV